MQRLVARSPWTFASRLAHYQALRCTLPVLSPEVATAAAAATDATAVKGRKPLPPPTEIVQLMHDELVEMLRKKEHFPNKQLYEMLGTCANYSDLKLGLHVLDRLHRARAADCRQYEAFKPEVLAFVARTFCRLKKGWAALEVFTKYNPYGLEPHISVSHELLKHATEVNNSMLTRDILKHMVQNSIMPTATTAHIIMQQCRQKLHIGTLLLIAKEFHANGVKLFPSTYDICLAAAANTGRLMMLEEIEGWMKHHEIRTSTSSTLSRAKARLLKGKMEESASILLDECKDPVKLRVCVGSMVKVWPVELAMSHTGGKKSAKSNMLKTKKSLENLLVCLASRGCKLDIDMEKDFGIAQGSGDKWEHCFGKREGTVVEEETISDQEE